MATHALRSTPLAAVTLLGLALAGCSTGPMPADADPGDVATDAPLPDVTADAPSTDAPSSDASDAAADAPGDTGPYVFSDHTVTRIASRAEFDALATTDHGIASTKVVISSFRDAANRGVYFFDSHFYVLHDEWYWYRLLNGRAVPGDDVPPVTGLGPFPTVRSIYDWALAQPGPLPLDLLFGGDRLYSYRFYDLSFGRERIRGCATLLHVEARTAPAPGAPERWAFELEYSDDVTHAELVTFFQSIEGGLAPEIGSRVYFLVRSAAHENLAQQMEREHLPYWDRILRYRDIVVPGAREVYSDGITAGILRVIRAGERFDDTAPDQVLVFEHTPDLLPPAAGLITAAPQTPLAHINLLARNRGIPNVHIAGVMEDAEVDQLARGWAPVVLFAEAPSRVVLAPITGEQYDRYRMLSSRPARSVVTPPTTTMPYFIDLSTRARAERESLIPTIGGKSAGMIALIGDGMLVRPDRPHGLTVRAYVEHVAPLRPYIDAALRAPRFDADARVRHTLLEGEASFRARNPGTAAIEFANSYLRENAAGTVLGDLARNGGVRGLIERTPIAPPTLATILSTLRTVYGDLAPTQGIRFRSSSNVEDVEGFNGAGLYESFTGFIDAASQPRASDRDKTVESAIRRVWGSYWGFEAFEERRVERIDHVSAAMGVMIHPRFDDPLERATGVCTFTALPPNAADDAMLVVNTQKGDESVANPDPTVLPEVVRVFRARGTGALRIVRERRSTLSPAEDLLSDEALRGLFSDTSRVTAQWLVDDNARRPVAQRGRTLTLDFEFHDMLAGWPAMRDGTVRPARLVLKQARSLEPGGRIALPEASSWPVPRDVFTRARRVTSDVCTAALPTGGTLRATRLRVLTDSSIVPDVGFSERPLDASLTLAVFDAEYPALGWARGASFTADHTAMTATTEGTTTRYAVTAGAPAAMGFDRFELSSSGSAVIVSGARRAELTMRCSSEIRFASPRDYLLSLIPAM